MVARAHAAVLHVAVLCGTDLTRATFRGASLYATFLIGATLVTADLTGARAIGALMDAMLARAKLVDARVGADRRDRLRGIVQTRNADKVIGDAP